MDTFVRFIKLLTALGLLALAAAIVFFASEIRQFRQQLPALLEQSEGYQQLIPEVLA